jgi:hypothetical protein
MDLDVVPDPLGGWADGEESSGMSVLSNFAATLGNQGVQVSAVDKNTSAIIDAFSNADYAFWESFCEN